MKAPAVPHLAGRDDSLRELGWRDWEAAWLTLVCLHSGVFTRPQFTEHHRCDRKAASRFVARLFDAGVAREHPLPEIDTRLHYCHLTGRGLYRALSIENVRHRRKAEDVVLWRRLLSFDHVVRHPDLPWLATEQEKVDYFTGHGIRRDQLPSRLYGGAAKRTRRYFALKLPIAADEHSATFVYCDPGRHTDRELQRWRSEHQALWAALRGLGTAVRVAAVARTVAAQHELSRKVAAWTQAVPSAAQPLTSEQRELLPVLEDAVFTAAKTSNPRLVAAWGGFDPARRLAIGLRKRADLEDSEGASGAAIDGFSTHHARGLAPQKLA